MARIWLNQAWGSLEEAAALAAALADLTMADIVVVSSCDGWERCFDHQAANALSRCGIDGRGMLKVCEEAKAAWDSLAKKLGRPPGDDVRPEGHGHPVAGVGIPGRKPWGRTVLLNKLGTHAAIAEVSVSSAELAAGRAEVEAKKTTDTQARARVAGTAKVVTPFRWQHEPGADSGYNTLPGHSFSSPSKTVPDAKDPKIILREPPEFRSLNPATN
ncbi:hypothetical protein T484DRAFT_1844048 [Baffinella frigidus]|nr:hypothetical protein T484DRAFT_1844048 [Cryptophyta sp. CCMP2293]